MSIPKIIHQTWKTEEIPPVYSRMVQSWQKHHPDWSYRLWTDEANRSFVARHFPGFLPQYDRYPAAIQRVDAVRYLILYITGGMFVDLDYECLRDMTGLLHGKDCVLGMEPEAHCRTHAQKKIISNAFMAAAPGMPFFAELYREIRRHRPATSHPFDRILESTGPFMLTRVYERYPAKTEITLLDSTLICPFTKDELAGMKKGFEPEDAATRYETGYAIHHYYGTWWRQDA